MVIFDATGLFHFKERHCPHCLKKVLNKGTEDEQAVYYRHVLEAEIVLGGGFVISIGTEFIEKDGKTKTLIFQWLTDLTVTIRNSSEFANAGRGRWCIENQGFNVQKNIRYDIQHADSLDHNAVKCHYLLTQIADILLQLYEKARPGIRKAKGAIKNISSDLLKSFGTLLTGGDIESLLRKIAPHS